MHPFLLSLVCYLMVTGIDLKGIIQAEKPSPYSVQRGGSSLLPGSVIVSMAPPGFQPSLIYKKFPEDDAVTPGIPWHLGIGVLLNGAPPSMTATLRLMSPQMHRDVAITGDTAVLSFQDGLHHNLASMDQFECTYTGSQSPFLGPIDFVLEIDGFQDVPITVHLNVVQETGFPVEAHLMTSSTTPIGNVVGDARLEVLATGQVGGVQGLFALDFQGNVLPGWPLDSNDSSLTNEGYLTPNLIDMDGDGLEEIVVMGSATRNARGSSSAADPILVKSLTVAEGSGAIRWRIEGDFETFSIPAVGDIDDDGELDIVVSGGDNLMRFEPDGTPFLPWQVQADHDIVVYFPVMADVDGDPSNGLEIIGCANNFAPQAPEAVYVWNHDGSSHGPEWPIEIDGACSPLAVVDLDSNFDNGLEIIMGVDYVESPPVDPKTGFLNTFTVFAWHADGSTVAGWPHRFLRDPNLGFADDRVIPGATAGDLDGDGDIEIVLGTYGLGDPANGNLFVFHHDGSLDFNWPRWAGIAQTPSAWGGTALADLDGDGRLEIVTASFRGIHVFRANGDTYPGFPRMGMDHFGQPMVADIDSDGGLEIVSSSLVDGLFAWKLLSPAVDRRPWPRFRQNPRNTGALPISTAQNAPVLGLPAMVLVFGGMAGFAAMRTRRGSADSERSRSC